MTHLIGILKKFSFNKLFR